MFHAVVSFADRCRKSCTRNRLECRAVDFRGFTSTKAVVNYTLRQFH